MDRPNRKLRVILGSCVLIIYSWMLPEPCQITRIWFKTMLCQVHRILHWQMRWRELRKRSSRWKTVITAQRKYQPLLEGVPWIPVEQLTNICKPWTVLTSKKFTLWAALATMRQVSSCWNKWKRRIWSMIYTLTKPHWPANAQWQLWTSTEPVLQSWTLALSTQLVIWNLGLTWNSWGIRYASIPLHSLSKEILKLCRRWPSSATSTIDYLDLTLRLKRFTKRTK